jgi:hypothetical protein
MNRILFGFLFGVLLKAQDVDIRLYSELQRIQANGEVAAADRAGASQEIISPAVVRNGFTTFHVAVTGRPKILYWLAIQTNPADLFQVRVYREQFLPSGIPDALVEEPKPDYFLGVMPDVPVERTTQVYLIDVWTPPDTPVGRVRFEVLVKTGDWVVAPMEVRVLAARVPKQQEVGKQEGKACCAVLPSPDSPADTASWPPLFAALKGGSSPLPPPPGTVRSVIMRNALQDAALVRSLDANTRARVFDGVWPVMAARLPIGPVSLRAHPESYLSLRQRIWNVASDLINNQGKTLQ